MQPKSISSESRLFEIASQQQGFFTTAQAVEAGFQDSTHPYHVRTGDWIREWRGIYRLARYPLSEEGQFVLWSLWSRNRKGIPQGVYSHETALSLYDLSDVMPQKLHMTVPPGFRRTSAIPNILVLHSGWIERMEIEERAGYCVTRPVRTIMDIVREQTVSLDLLRQTYSESIRRGLIRPSDFSKYRRNPEFNENFVEAFGENK